MTGNVRVQTVSDTGEEMGAEEVVQKLRKLESDYLKQLSQVESKLEDMGFVVEHFKSPDAVCAGAADAAADGMKKPKKVPGEILAKKPLSGININGKLSFRGIEKSYEYFDRLDEDHDGFLNFGDFRAMKALSTGQQFVLADEYLSKESWMMLMDDAGVRVDADGHVDKAGFAKYRQVVESESPLERDLDFLKLGYLPGELKLWHILKGMLREVGEHRSCQLKQMLTGGQGPASDESYDPTAPLSMEEVSYILANSGLVFTKADFMRAAVDRAWMEKLIETLDRVFTKKNLVGSDERFAKELGEGHIPTHGIRVHVREDIKKVQPGRLLAWVFARRPSSVEGGPYYRRLISLKYAIYRKVRYIDERCKVIYKLALHFRARLIYRSFHVEKSGKESAAQGGKGAAASEAKERAELHMQCTVGSGQVSDEGLSCTWQLQKLQSVDETLRFLQLPRDSGTALVVDFLVRDGISDEAATKAADNLKLFLINNFNDELRKSMQFRGLFCFNTTNDADGANIIRLAICYRRIFSLDWFLSQAYIPYSLSNLFPEFSGEVRSSVSFSDIVSNTIMSLDNQLTVTVQLHVKYMRDLLLSLLQRTWLACSAALTQEEVDEAEEGKKKKEQDDLGAEVSFKEMFLKMSYLRQFYPIVVSACKRAHAYIYGVDKSDISFKYKGLSQLLYSMGSYNLWMRQAFPKELGSLPGLFAATYGRLLGDLVGEMKQAYESLKEHLECKVREEENAYQRKLFEEGLIASDKTEEQLKKEQTAEKMRQLGIEVEDDMFIVESEDPLTYAQQVYDDMRNRDINALILYERMWNCCVGVHNVQLVSGSSRLNFSFQGMDIFEVLPPPQPMEAVKLKCEAIRNKRKVKDEEKELTKTVSNFSV